MVSIGRLFWFESCRLPSDSENKLHTVEDGKAIFPAGTY